jgi:uncharacterized membrane protein YgdD (TMEM256/DUF423 family)
MRIWTLTLTAIGGLIGAAGVSAAAAAAHVANTAGMNAIAQIGMAHGAALVALAALAQGMARPVWTLGAASLIAFGAGAFCLELGLRHFLRDFDVSQRRADRRHGDHRRLAGRRRRRLRGKWLFAQAID